MIHQKQNNISNGDANPLITVKQFENLVNDKQFNSSKRIGVIGMACRFPLNTSDPMDFWNSLKIGRDNTIKIPCSRIENRDNLISQTNDNSLTRCHLLSHDISLFDANFFGISKSEGEKMDPQQRLLLECIYECMENANLTTLNDTGMFIGVMSIEYANLANKLDIISMLGSSASVISGRLNHIFNSNAPSITIDTACSSSLVALDLAVKAISNNECSKAIVAGVNLILTEDGLRRRMNGGMLSTDGLCKAFDAEANGYGRADGCAVLLLEAIDSKVLRSILGYIEITSVNHKGRSISLTTPKQKSQEKLYKKCLRNIPRDINVTYWEAHGTGTNIGDKKEVRSLSNCLNECIIGTAKAHIGHTEAGSGAAGFIKLLLQMQHEYTASHIHFSVAMNKFHNKLRLPLIGEEWFGNAMGISSFGVSGTNAAAIITKPLNNCRELLLSKSQKNFYICPVSAKSELSLYMLIDLYAQMLHESSHALWLLCTCAAINRNHFKYRAVFLANKSSDRQIKKILPKSFNEINRPFGIKLSIKSLNTQNFIKWFAVKANRKKFKKSERIIQRINEKLIKFYQKSLSEKYLLLSAYFYALIMQFIDIGLQIDAIEIAERRSIVLAFALTNIFEKKNEKIMKKNSFSTNRKKFFQENVKIFISSDLKQQLLLVYRLSLNNYLFDKQNSSNNDYKWFDLKKISHSNFYDLIGQFYINGATIIWKKICKTPVQSVYLPNYTFNREKLWCISGKEEIFDDSLLGRIVKKFNNIIEFENYININDNPDFFDYLIDNEEKFPFGLIIDLTIRALKFVIMQQQQNDRSQFPSVQLINLKFKKQTISKNGFWIRIRLSRTNTIHYNIVINSQNNILFSADLQLCKSFSEKNIVKKLPKIKMRPILRFYEILEEKGIKYRRNMQIIAVSSKNGEYFRIKCLESNIWTMASEAILQILYFKNILSAKNFDILSQINNIRLDSSSLPVELYIKFSYSAVLLCSKDGIVFANFSIKTEFNEKLHNENLMKIIDEEKLESQIDKKYQNEYMFPENREKLKLTINDVANKVKRAMEDVLGGQAKRDDFQLSDTFNKYGFDSLAITDLTNRLSEKYFSGIDIRVVDIFESRTVESLANFIFTKLKIKELSKHVEMEKYISDNETSKDSSEFSQKDSGLSLSRADSNESLISFRPDDRCFFIRKYSSIRFDYNDEMHLRITITDKKTDQRQAIILNSNNSELAYDKERNNWIVNSRCVDQILKALENLTATAKRQVILQFDFKTDLSIASLARILLTISRFMVNSKNNFIVLNESRFGRANAFATGFMKSLSAEYYPKIRFLWNFSLENWKISDVKPVKSTVTNANTDPENWLITGGTRGLGWQMALWIAANRRVSNITLVGRNPLPSNQQNMLNKIRKTINIEILSVDITVSSQVRKLFKHSTHKFTSIIHSAGTIDDAILIKQTEEKIQKVASAKCIGLLLLAKMSDRYSHPLKHFILNSSIASVIGNRGQCNYSAANAYADEFMRERRAKGFPATIINWGNWLETGMAIPITEHLRKIGLIGLNTTDALSYLRFAIEQNPDEIIVANFNFKILIKNRVDLESVFQNFVKNLPSTDTNQMISMVNKGANPSRNHKLSPCSNVNPEKKFNSISAIHNFFALVIGSKTIEGLRLKIDLIYDLILKSDKNMTSIILEFSKRDMERKFLSTIFIGKNRLQIAKHIAADRNYHNIIEFNVQQKPIVCFVFSGQGSQLWNMGRQLMQFFPLFRDNLLQTLSIAQTYMPNNSSNLSSILYEWPHYLQLYSTEYAQPIIFCFCYALAKLYNYFGVEANYYVGHSIGEIVAFTLAGMITLEDALKIIVQRGQTLGQLKGKGQMLVVNGQIRQELFQKFNIEIAAENSNRQLVIAGNNHAIRDFLNEQWREDKNFNAFILNHEYPFHSSIVKQIDLKKFHELCEQIQFNELENAVVVSNISGKLLRKLSANYLINHLYSTVQFKKSIITVKSFNTKLWLEIGVGETLSNCIRNIIDNHSSITIPSLQNNIMENESIIRSLVELENHGLLIDWQKVYSLGPLITSSYRLADDINCPFISFIKLYENFDGIEFQHQIHEQAIIPAALPLTILLILSTNSKYESNEGEQRIRATLGQIILRKPIKTLTDNGLNLIKQGDTLQLIKDDIILYECKLYKSGKMHKMHLNIDANLNSLDYRNFYETLRVKKLQYSPLFMILRNIWRKNGESGEIIAELVNIDYPFLIIEGAFQTLLAAAFDHIDPIIYIPVRINILEIDCSRETRGKSYIAHGIITEQNSNLLRGSVMIFEADKPICLAYDIIGIAKNTKWLRNISNSIDHFGSTANDEMPKQDGSYLKLKSNNKKNHQSKLEQNTEGSSETRNASQTNQHIAIIGYYGQFTDSLQDNGMLWNNIKASCTDISDNKFSDKIEQFDPEFFDISPKESIFIDPQQRLILEAVQRTMENAGLKKLDQSTGTFIGISSSDFAQKAYAEMKHLNPYLSTGTSNSTIAGRIAHWLNLTGPTVVLDTACSSFMSALICACDNLIQGRCKMALVGAVNLILSEKTTEVLQLTGVLSEKGYCKSFDAAADGYKRSNGIAMILLKNLRDINNFSGVFIKTYAIGHNGKTSGITVPSGNRQCFLMSSALEKLQPYLETIDQVEAHATGTKLGDSIEISSICKTIKNFQMEKDFYLTSVKCSLGHCETAAGAASLIFVIHSSKNKYLPAIEHFSLRNPEAKFYDNFILPIIGIEFESERTVLINCFGLSGTNVCLILQSKSFIDKKREPQSNTSISARIAVISAKSSTKLANMLDEFEEFIMETNQPLTDICTSLQCSRKHYKHRAAAILSLTSSKFFASKFIVGEYREFSVLYIFDDKSISFVALYDLLVNFKRFRRIFLINYFKLTNHKFISRKFTKIQIVTRISLFKWFSEIGLKPSVIYIKNDASKPLIETLIEKIIVKNNSKKLFSKFYDYTTKFINELPEVEFDFAFNLDALWISNKFRNEDDNGNFSYASISQQLALAIARLYISGIDVNWQKFNPRNKRKYECNLPSYIFNKRKFWAFNDEERFQKINNTNSVENCGGNLKNHRIPEFQKSDNISNLEVASESQSRSSSEENFEPLLFQNSQLKPSEFSTKKFSHGGTKNTRQTFDNDYKKWLYQLHYVKRDLDETIDHQLEKFVAINFPKMDKWISSSAKACCSTTYNTNDDTLIVDLLRNCDCRHVIIHWENSGAIEEQIISQSLIIIRLWIILDKFYSNSKPAITVCLMNQKIATGCGALLRSLASERPTITYKLIEIDEINAKILREISSSCRNEIVKYFNEIRYVQRLKRFHVISKFKKPKLNRILITGGLGGIGQALIKHLRPKRVIVMSRNLHDAEIKKLQKNSKTKITIAQGDCSKFSDVKRIFNKTKPFDVVIHCAGIVENALMENMDQQKFLNVFAAKIHGTINLVKLCEENKISKLITFSSMASVFGSAGQANYAVANQIMEQLVISYNSSLVLSWGPWADLGMLNGSEKKFTRNYIIQNGWNFLPKRKALTAMINLIHSVGHFIIMDIDMDQIIKKTPHLANLCEFIMNKDRLLVRHNEGSQQAWNHSTSQRKSTVNDILRKIIWEVSGNENIDEETGFMSIGIDSLMIAEIRRSILREWNIDLPMATFYDKCTLRLLEDNISEILSKSDNKPNKPNAFRESTILGDDQIAIIGYSGGFSGAQDIESFWQNLIAGKESINNEQSGEPIDDGDFVNAAGILPDCDKFDPKFWKLCREDAMRLDPQIRKFVEHAYWALEKSGEIKNRRNIRIAVLAGAEPSDYNALEKQPDDLIARLYAKNQKDFLASWTSYLLNLNGPSFGVYSACSTGLLAVAQAINLLKNEQCDIAIAGASSLVLPHQPGYYYKEGGIFSPTGQCRPFDQNSNGTVRGSAIAVIVLCKLKRAISKKIPVKAIIENYSVNNDGSVKASFMAPNVTGQTSCLREATRFININDVMYVECHGTATRIGDNIELTAMSSVYNKKLYIGSVKANIGHGFASSGIAGLIKLCEIIKHRIIPKQINFTNMNEGFPSTKYTIPVENICIEERGQFAVGVSSFGIGGTNVHMVLRSPPDNLKPTYVNRKKYYILPISAKSEESCIMLCHRIAEFINEKTSDLPSLAYTLQNYREEFAYRVAFVVSDIEDAIKQLRGVSDVTFSTKIQKDNIAFYFSSQGIQYTGMAQDMLSEEEASVFSEEMQKCRSILSQLLGIDIFNILYPADTNNCHYITDKRYTQVINLITNYSIYQQLKQWGIECSVAIGHSSGEYSAATCGGVFDLSTAIEILIKRSRLMSSTKKYAMIAIRDYSGIFPKEIEITAILSNRLVCVVGQPDDISHFKKELSVKNIEFRDLNVDLGFHSSAMEPIMKQFGEYLDQFHFHQSSLSILSNIDGQVVHEFNSDYMVKHMRKIIRIDKCLANLPSAIKAIVEIGPKGILSNLIEDTRHKIVTVPTIAAKNQNSKSSINLLTTIADLWRFGANIEWNKIFPEANFDSNIPNYQFQKEICWNNEVFHEAHQVKIHKQCWIDVPIKANNAFRPKGVLIFMLNYSNPSIAKLLLNLKNQFIQYLCVIANINIEKFSIIKNSLCINPFVEESYQYLAEYLQNLKFDYQLIIHVWNFIDEFDNDNEDSDNDNEKILQLSFYSILWIKKYFINSNIENMKIAMIAENRAPPEFYTSLAPLRELQATHPGISAFSIILPSNINLWEILDKACSLPEITQFSLLRYDGQILQQIAYKEVEMKKYSQQICNGNVVLIFGGTGFLGRSFALTLMKHFSSLKIILISRNAIDKLKNRNLFKQLDYWSKKSNHQLIAYNTNIGDSKNVGEIIRKFYSNFGKINVIIHAAGQATNQVTEKTIRQIKSVFEAKIKGTLNFLRSINENNIQVELLVLTSSLSSMLGLHGNVDYSAANIFLDAVASSRITNIKNIVSIQWSGWQESEMLVNYNKIPQKLRELLLRGSLSKNEGQNAFLKCISQQGTIAVSLADPITILEKVKNIQFPNRNRNENSLRIEHSQSFEGEIKKIWERTMATKMPSSSANFFELGGNSLNGMQIVWEINKLMGIRCTINDLFDHPNFMEFLQFLQENYQVMKNLDSNIPRYSGEIRFLPLSFSQENMFLLRTIHEPTLYNIQFLISFKGNLETTFINKALRNISARQASLRTIFYEDHGNIYQEILSLTESYHHLNWLPIEIDSLEKIIADEKRINFTLKYIPYRIVSLKTTDNKFNLIISFHHIITDGWSMTIFAKELVQSYLYYKNQKLIGSNNKITGKEKLEPVNLRIVDFAIWQRSEDHLSKIAKDLPLVVERLKATKATTIRTDRAGKLCGSTNHETAQYIFNLPEIIKISIKELANRNRTTDYVIMLTAFICVIRRFSSDFECDQIVIGCPVSGRCHSAIESLIGYFLNNIIILVDNVKRNSTIEDLIAIVIEATRVARRFEHIPFHQIVAAMDSSQRQPNKHPIFEIFFNYRHNLDFPNITIPNVKSDIQQLTTNNIFDFSFTIDEKLDTIVVTIDYNSTIYRHETIAKFSLEYIRTIGDNSIITGDNSVDNDKYHSLSYVIPTFPTSMNGMNVVWNVNDLTQRYRSDFPENMTVSSIIFEQCQLHANAIAMLVGHSTETYSTLIDRSIVLTQHLQQIYFQQFCEVPRSDNYHLVVIDFSSPDLLMIILAIMLSGAAYVPLDPKMSESRYAQMRRTLKSNYLVVDAVMVNTYKSKYCNKKIKLRTIPEDLAYIIFTSGSTGDPKGVCITHRNLVNFTKGSSQQIFLRANMKVYNSVNYVFDVSCMNIFTTLCNGSTLVAGDNLLKAPEEIISLRIDFAFLPSALFNTFDEHNLKRLIALEKLFIGGESPNEIQLEKCLKLGIYTRQIYGPTETTIWSLTNLCKRREYECARNLGCPMENEYIVLLDNHVCQMPNYGIAELAITGDGVARGYLSGATGEAFLPNTFRSDEEKILGRNNLLYRTGDLIRIIGNKVIFNGRKDSQLKIRGYRIEPAEIEEAIRYCDNSIAGIFIYKHEATNSLVTVVEKSSIDSRSLLKSVAKIMPPYLVPQIIITMNEFPLNNSGKVDKHKLMEIIERDYIVNKNCSSSLLFEDELTETEKKLAKIWNEILCMKKISRYDNFFNSGGHSLMIVLLRNKIHEKFDVELPFENLFRAQTLAGISREIDDKLHTNRTDKTESIITVLRETTHGKYNLYAIHAISGTIYPYYSIVNAIPDYFNVYAIEYQLSFKESTLNKLAEFYANQVRN